MLKADATGNRALPGHATAWFWSDCLQTRLGFNVNEARSERCGTLNKAGCDTHWPAVCVAQNARQVGRQVSPTQAQAVPVQLGEHRSYLEHLDTLKPLEQPGQPNTAHATLGYKAAVWICTTSHALT